MKSRAKKLPPMKLEDMFRGIVRLNESLRKEGNGGVRMALQVGLDEPANDAARPPKRWIEKMPHRLTRVDKDGRFTTQDDYVAVYDAETDLTWLAEPVGAGARYNWKAALEACAAVRMFGKSDWRAPTIQELLTIVDYDRCDPAVHTGFFKGPYDWTWSSTEAKSPAGCAWVVLLLFGDSLRNFQSGDYLVRAVRAGQSLELGL